MKHVDDVTFRSEKIIGGSGILGGAGLSRCTWVGSTIAQFDDPGFGLVVRDVESRRCKVDNCGAHGVRFQDVLVDGLTVAGGLLLEACLFERVTLRGNIGRVVTTPPHSALAAEVRQSLVDGMRAAYRDVEWALDIRQANFVDADFSYVPGELVRRDEETQFLLRRESFSGMDVSDLPGYAKIAVGRFESRPWDSIVAIAPRRSKKFDRWLSELTELRRAGLAE
ncbi:hypothetical protein [Streptomyces sp. NPDC000878]